MKIKINRKAVVPKASPKPEQTTFRFKPRFIKGHYYPPNENHLHGGRSWWTRMPNETDEELLKRYVKFGNISKAEAAKMLHLPRARKKNESEEEYNEFLRSMLRATIAKQNQQRGQVLPPLPKGQAYMRNSKDEVYVHTFMTPTELQAQADEKARRQADEQEDAERAEKKARRVKIKPSLVEKFGTRPPNKPVTLRNLDKEFAPKPKPKPPEPEKVVVVKPSMASSAKELAKVIPPVTKQQAEKLIAEHKKLYPVAHEKSKKAKSPLRVKIPKRDKSKPDPDADLW